MVTPLGGVSRLSTFACSSVCQNGYPSQPGSNFAIFEVGQPTLKASQGRIRVYIRFVDLTTNCLRSSRRICIIKSNNGKP